VQLHVATEQFWLGTMPSVRMALMLIMTGGAALWLLCRNASVQRRGQLVAVAAAGVICVAVTVQAVSVLFSPTGLAAGIILLAACSAAGLVLAVTVPRSRRLLADLSCIILAVGVPPTMLLIPDRLPNAWISYGAMFGTRLYGIGNEMAGAWLGATVLAVAPLLRPPLHRAAFGVLTLCAFLAALPEWGANLGAGIAFAIAAAHVAAQQGSPRWRALKGFATALILIGSIALALRALDRGSGASHLGRALALQQPLMQIVLRKLMLNVSTILHSTWTVTVLAGLLCGELIRRKSGAPFGSEVFALLWVAAAAILVFNDTGIVAAGLCLATAVSALTLRRKASPP
jgi:hypothetical protein